jgi:hypothetical protein
MRHVSTLLAAFDHIGSETNEELTAMQAIYNGVAEPLSVLQAGNGAMFAASLHSICPTLGLGFILCHTCAVLSIELFGYPFSSFGFSFFFVVSFNFMD